MQRTDGRRPDRRDKLIREHDHDPYRDRVKLHDPTVCPECGATFHAGRWTWAAGTVDAPRAACPACRRIRDDYPAGYVTLRGAFAGAHREELLGLVRNLEGREKGAHPLHRIMHTRDEGDRLVITTTDAHLARSIGTALHAAYEGDLDIDHSEAENLVRVTWSR